jgi:DNA repair ATPase RecN
MATTLSLLRIKNLALVEDLEWQMGPGFTAITGETGAGKSIIMARSNCSWASGRTNR